MWLSGALRDGQRDVHWVVRWALRLADEVLLLELRRRRGEGIVRTT